MSLDRHDPNEQHMPNLALMSFHDNIMVSEMTLGVAHPQPIQPPSPSLNESVNLSLDAPHSCNASSTSVCVTNNQNQTERSPRLISNKTQQLLNTNDCDCNDGLNSHESRREQQWQNLNEGSIPGVQHLWERNLKPTMTQTNYNSILPKIEWDTIVQETIQEGTLESHGDTVIQNSVCDRDQDINHPSSEYVQSY